MNRYTSGKQQRKHEANCLAVMILSKPIDTSIQKILIKFGTILLKKETFISIIYRMLYHFSRDFDENLPNNQIDNFIHVVSFCGSFDF